MQHHPMDLSGKLILITGASSGIGRETAILLSKLGARVILNGRHSDTLVQTQALMEGDGHIISPFDMSRTDEIADWVVSLTKAHGPADGFVHCAGVQENRSIRLFDAAFFDTTMHTNLASALAVAKGFRQRRNRERQGAIVLVSSIAGLIGQSANVVYGASKAGLMSATRGLAMELLRDNIRVNCVAPALVNTEMASKTRDNMTEAQFQSILDQHPMGIGEPVDVANAIAFLLSDAARWINAVTLPVEGGYLAN
ncbi:SDR family oxidoreductase [Shewanella sp. JM162201]|uniref:SDR family oxidoreductase n=1 Tax=Shewanella jiangmenensis TaxID=2837387 RepID=A0ABS5V564_9GAMM|nr:SDR family oxidoreductase [Shewanella jiangmenensis]